MRFSSTKSGDRENFAISNLNTHKNSNGLIACDARHSDLALSHGNDLLVVRFPNRTGQPTSRWGSLQPHLFSNSMPFSFRRRGLRISCLFSIVPAGRHLCRNSDSRHTPVDATLNRDFPTKMVKKSKTEWLWEMMWFLLIFSIGCVTIIDGVY